MPRGATPGRNLGKEVAQGYAAHPWPPDLTVATNSTAGRLAPVVSASAGVRGPEEDPLAPKDFIHR